VALLAYKIVLVLGYTIAREPLLSSWFVHVLLVGGGIMWLYLGWTAMPYTHAHMNALQGGFASGFLMAAVALILSEALGGEDTSLLVIFGVPMAILLGGGATLGKEYSIASQPLSNCQSLAELHLWARHRVQAFAHRRLAEGAGSDGSNQNTTKPPISICARIQGVRELELAPDDGTGSHAVPTGGAGAALAGGWDSASDPDGSDSPGKEASSGRESKDDAEADSSDRYGGRSSEQAARRRRKGAGAAAGGRTGKATSGADASEQGPGARKGERRTDPGILAAGAAGAGAALFGAAYRVAGSIVTSAHAALEEAAAVLSQADGARPDTFYGALLVAEGMGSHKNSAKALQAHGAGNRRSRKAQSSDAFRWKRSDLALLAQAERAYRQAQRRFGASPDAHLLFSVFARDHLPGMTAESQALAEARTRGSAFDSTFYIYLRTRNLRDGEATGLSAVDRVVFEGFWNQAQDLKVASYRAIFQLWEAMQQRQPEIGQVLRVGEDMQRIMDKSD
jgi:hypothetical protein